MDSLSHLEGPSILLLYLTGSFYAEMWAQVKLVQYRMGVLWIKQGKDG